MERKNFAVLGLGRFGKNVALTLEEMGYNVLGVDKDENVATELAESLTKVVSFDIRDEHALKEIGISEFDVVIIASKSLEASLMATMLCNELNVGEIIVKAIDERHAKMAERLGASRVIFSERDTARRLARSLTAKNIEELSEIDDNIRIIRVKVPEKLVGKNLINSKLRSDYGLNAIAIQSGNEMIISPSYVFKAEDKIYLIGTNESLLKFERELT
ncbi:MAG: TrkA family potassium uptake protein [Selenomonadaceae bacterium]|nr:TrkA family potassium uptake protein [Selenomonadaceae bacterium]